MDHLWGLDTCRRRGNDADLADRQRRRRSGERPPPPPGGSGVEHLGLHHVHVAHFFFEQQHVVLDEHGSVVIVIVLPGLFVEFWPTEYPRRLVVPNDPDRWRSRGSQLSTR
jgi:hypothetical protein